MPAELAYRATDPIILGDFQGKRKVSSATMDNWWKETFSK